jgi:hypothetical protein
LIGRLVAPSDMPRALRILEERHAAAYGYLAGDGRRALIAPIVHVPATDRWVCVVRRGTSDAPRLNVEQLSSRGGVRSIDDAIEMPIVHLQNGVAHTDGAAELGEYFLLFAAAGLAAVHRLDVITEGPYDGKRSLQATIATGRQLMGINVRGRPATVQLDFQRSIRLSPSATRTAEWSVDARRYRQALPPWAPPVDAEEEEHDIDSNGDLAEVDDEGGSDAV